MSGSDDAQPALPATGTSKLTDFTYKLQSPKISQCIDNTYLQGKKKKKSGYSNPASFFL